MLARPVRPIVLLPLLVSLACGGAGGTDTKAAGTATPAVPPKPKAPFVPLDACSLLTKAEVEALVGRPSLEPAREQMANLVTCAFGDPEAPKIAGRPATQVLTLSVFTGEEGAYHAGPAAQARDAYDTARRNAASSESVAGLGDTAYWDETFKTLSAVKGRYWVSAEVGAGEDVAKKVMAKAVERLP